MVASPPGRVQDIYPELEVRATRLREEDFIAWIKDPVLLIDFPDVEAAVITNPSMSPESTVLLQDVQDSAFGIDGNGGTRQAHRLNMPVSGDTALAIGRSDDSDIVLDHDSISKVHAYIERGPDGAYYVRDAESRNGVTVNGKRIARGGSVRVRPDDVLRVGAVMARIVYPRPLYTLLKHKVVVGVWQPFKDRAFAAFWFGQTFWCIADSLYRVVLTWWVMSRTGTTAAISAIAIFTILPMLATLLASGLVVDRLPRSQVLVLSMAMRGLVMAIVSFTQINGTLHMWHLYAAGIGLGVSEAFFQPAYAAIVPELVGREHLHAANSLNTTGVQGATIAGPILGAVLSRIGGLSTGFLCVSISFMVGCLCMARLPTTASPRAVHHDERPSGGIGEAVRTMVHDVSLWLTSLIWNLSFGVGFAVAAVVMPLLLERSLHRDIGYYGIMQSLFSAGALASSLWQRRRPHPPSQFASYLAAVAIGASIVAPALPITVYGVGVAWFVRGIATTLLGLAWVAMLQRRVPREMLGRVASLDKFLGVALLVVAFLTSGWLSSRVVPELLFLVGGVLTLALPLVALILRRKDAADA